jgi:spermidine synthase
MARRPKPDIHLSETDGIRYLHFGTEWVQGAMDIRHPGRLVLEYQQHMMAALAIEPRPRQILQLGLGAAALTRACLRQVRGSRVQVVDISQAVIDMAYQCFQLPAHDDRLTVHCADAGRFLKKNKLAVDLLQVDLYDADAQGPVLDDDAFYGQCRDTLTPQGMAAINLFGSSLRPSLDAISSAFGQNWLRLPASAAGNVVVLAFAGDHWRQAQQASVAQALRLETRCRFPVLDVISGARLASGKRWISAAMP